MPNPISVNPSPVTIPPVYIEGDASPPPAPAPAVTVPEVTITGDAPSVHQLVKALDAAKAARSCAQERTTAVYGALDVVAAAVGTVLATGLGPLGVIGGLSAVSAVSYEEGQKLRALYNCETE